MFIATSTIQNAVWGWASKPLPTTGKGAIFSQASRFSNYTLGPDGWVYALPCVPTISVTNSDQVVLVLDPGQANSNKTNYSAAAGQFINADGSATRPYFPTRLAGAGALFESKGVVAPNGKIYFFTKTHNILCEITPAGLSTTWKLYDFTADTNPLNTQYMYYLGVILGKDGKLYLIPNGSAPKLIRFNISGATPVVETSWIDGVNASFFSYIKTPLGKAYTAGNVTCDDPAFTTCDPITNSNNALGGQSFNSSRISAGLACLDPIRTSNKIYFTIQLGTWIMWIDPDNWGNANVVGTVEDLWLRKLVGNYEGYRTNNSIIGCLNSPFKFGALTPGANRKLYINITNTATNGTGDTTIYYNAQRQLSQHTIEIDTAANVATLRPSVTGERIQAFYGGADMMPNGYVFVLPSVLAITSGAASAFGGYHRNVLQIDTNRNTAVVRPEAHTTNTSNPGWKNLDISNPDGFLCPSTVNNANAEILYNNIVVLPGDKRGKVIIAGRNTTFGVELMSVKGFYKGVTHFDLTNTYDPANNVNKIEMPSNVAQIAASDYNVYYNKIT